MNVGARDELIGVDAWRDLPSVAWAPPARRTLVVVPHPDDEVLGCGGLIGRQTRNGVPVVIFAVTDGEAAHGGVDPVLAALRCDEQARALAELGLTPEHVVRLRLPDGGVERNVDELTSLLSKWVTPDDLLVAPWEGDHHIDHVACARAASRVARTVGCHAIGSLVWAPIRSPHPDAEHLPLLRLDLTPLEHACRLRAMEHHHSQLDASAGTPIVVDELAARLMDPLELYIETTDAT